MLRESRLLGGFNRDTLREKRTDVPQRRLRLNISYEKLEEMHPADLADIVEELGPAEREAIFESIDSESAAEALPSLQMEMEVTADIKLTDVNGKVIFSGMRSATADYTTNTQGLANDAASADAIKRAALSLSDTIRLTLLGALGK